MNLQSSHCPLSLYYHFICQLHLRKAAADKGMELRIRATTWKNLEHIMPREISPTEKVHVLQDPIYVNHPKEVSPDKITEGWWPGAGAREKRGETASWMASSHTMTDIFGN